MTFKHRKLEFCRTNMTLLSVILLLVMILGMSLSKDTNSSSEESNDKYSTRKERSSEEAKSSWGFKVQDPSTNLEGNTTLPKTEEPNITEPYEENRGDQVMYTSGHNISTPVPDGTTHKPTITTPVPDGTTHKPTITTQNAPTSPNPNDTDSKSYDNSSEKVEHNVVVKNNTTTEGLISEEDGGKPLPGATAGSTADDIDSKFVRLAGHRYEGVVVHIGDDVPFSESLLRNIKMLFRKSQVALESATRPPKANEGGLTFGRVIITVPSYWEMDFSAPPVSLGPPSVKVEPPSSSHGHVPYTLQPGGCGERGLYIHLTPEFVNSMFTPIVEDRIGKAESVFVHEWAHLRWGVFDEYVTPDDLAHPHMSLVRPFYLDDKGQVKPSGCPLNTQGWIVEEVNEEDPTPSFHAINGILKVTSSNISSSNMSSEVTITEHNTHRKGDETKDQDKEATPSLRLCKSFTSTGLPAPHCFFYPDSKPETNGSLMGYFSKKTVSSEDKRFCGNGDDEVLHDPAAPTPHNLRCGGRSVWEVMREHDDFASHCGYHQGGNETSLMTPLQEPRFIIYKRQNPKALLIILNCAQLPNDTLSSIKSGLIRFIGTFVPNDTKVLSVTSQSLVLGTEDLTIDRQPADFQLDALTCDPGGTDKASLAAADWLTSQSLSHSLVLTLQSSPDRGLYDQLRPRLPLNSTLHAVTVEQACPDKLLMTSERMFSCTEHRNGTDLAETLRGVLASHSAKEGLTKVYAKSHPLQHTSAGRHGTKTSVSGHFFMNFCRGSSLLSVFAPTRVFGRNFSSVDMTLFRDGTETPLSLYEQKLYAGTGRVNVVIKIPCDSAYGDWKYVIRTPTPPSPTVHERPPETEPMVDVKVYQHEDEDATVRVSSFILVKKRVSRNCTEVDKPRISNDSGNNTCCNSSNSSRNDISSDKSNDTENATEKSPYNGVIMLGIDPEPETGTFSIASPIEDQAGVTTESLLDGKHLNNGTKKDQEHHERKRGEQKPKMNAYTNTSQLSKQHFVRESREQPKVHGGRTISYNDSVIRIVSVVTQGAKGEQTPVLRASVTAFVSKEHSNDSFQVPLLDSGIAADEIADDGIYSGFLTGISSNGNYSVSVEATDRKSSRRRINTIRQTLFWDQHPWEEDSPSGMDLYRMKVHCSGDHTASTLQVQQRLEGSAETAAPLVVLVREDHKGSSSGRMYSGEATISHSGKLIVPKGCVIIAVTGQGEGAPDRRKSTSPHGSSGGSSAHVLPIVKIPNQAFDTPANTTFSRHLPVREEGQDDGRSDVDGGEERISKETDVKEREVLELTAETSKFRVKRAVQQLEVVQYTSRDILPPGRVRDLTVTKVHYMRPAVTLEWSSPGDDLYSGTAHSIELRYHQMREGLRVAFQLATLVLEGKHVPHGALKPLAAGENQSVIIILKDISMDDLKEDYTLHFGLIAWDEANNAGVLSNLAEARFTVTEKEMELKGLSSSKQLLSIAFSVLVAVLGFVFVLVCFAKIKDHLQKRKKADCYDFSYLDTTISTKFGTNPRSRGRESSTRAGGLRMELIGRDPDV